MRILLFLILFSSFSFADTVDTTCSVIEAAARQNGLPINFFTRLIWQESKFDSASVSPAGAQGVAQFMPSTAYGRGLLNPFDPRTALFESASYLHELRAEFGNLGLAAAAYNGGPGRLSRYIKGSGFMPAETLNYVTIATGHSLDEWMSAKPPEMDSENGFDCVKFAGSAGTGALPNLTRTPGASPALKPWAVILAGTFQQGQVLAEFERLRRRFPGIIGDAKPSVVRKHLGNSYTKCIVMITKDSRAQADKLCSGLEAKGGACVVLRSSVR